MKVARGLLDLRFAQFSAFMLAISVFLMGLAPNMTLVIGGMVLLSTGAAMDLLIRSVATTLVDSNHVAALYTSIAIVESIASCIAAPTIAVLYKWGMLLGGQFQGLPFLVVGGLLAFCFFGMLFVTLPKNTELGQRPEDLVDELFVQEELHITA